MTRKRLLLFIKFYYLHKPSRIYEIYTALTLYYIAISIIRGSRKGDRVWNVLPVDTGFRLYIDWV
jgi:hypothetical protein